MAKLFLSGLNGEEVDQDHNAAKNLSYWSELNASTGLVEASAPTRHPGLPQMAVQTEDRTMG